jgi:hypothetical protein
MPLDKAMEIKIYVVDEFALKISSHGDVPY